MTPADTTVVFETEARVLDGTGVTVAVSLYNYQSYIGDALDSVVQQTHANTELIVVDDASTDGSIAVARSWIEQSGARLARARLLAHRKNAGLAQARNTAFAAAGNEFVFVLDADNALYPDAIAKLLSACLSSGAEAAYSHLEYFGHASGLCASSFWNPPGLATGNYIDAMALIRKSAWQAVGGYSHIEFGWEDYDLWCKFVERGFRGVFVPEILCRYRMHPASMLHRSTSPNIGRLRAEMMKRHPWLRLDAPRERPSRQPASRNTAAPARYATTKIGIGNGARDFCFRPGSADVAALKRVFVGKSHDLRTLGRFPQLAALAHEQQSRGLRPLIIDAGANIGAAAVYFAAGFPNGLIVAVEPDWTNFELLVRNVAGLNIQPVLSAIGPGPGYALVCESSGSSGHRTKTVGADEQSADVVLQVAINQIYESYHAGTFPFIVKIDFESVDEGLFSANTEWIDRTPVIAIELHERPLAARKNEPPALLRRLSRPDRKFYAAGAMTFSIAERLESFRPGSRPTKTVDQMAVTPTA